MAVEQNFLTKRDIASVYPGGIHAYSGKEISLTQGETTFLLGNAYRNSHLNRGYYLLLLSTGLPLAGIIDQINWCIFSYQRDNPTEVEMLEKAHHAPDWARNYAGIGEDPEGVTVRVQKNIQITEIEDTRRRTRELFFYSPIPMLYVFDDDYTKDIQQIDIDTSVGFFSISYQRGVDPTVLIQPGDLEPASFISMLAEFNDSLSMSDIEKVFASLREYANPPFSQSLQLE